MKSATTKNRKLARNPVLTEALRRRGPRSHSAMRSLCRVDESAKPQEDNTPNITCSQSGKVYQRATAGTRYRRSQLGKARKPGIVRQKVVSRCRSRKIADAIWSRNSCLCIFRKLRVPTLLFLRALRRTSSHKSTRTFFACPEAFSLPTAIRGQKLIADIEEEVSMVTKLKLLLVRREILQVDLSRDTGISEPRLSRIVRGRVEATG